MGTPTSKKLTWVITIFFLFLICAIGAIDLICGVQLAYLLGYVMPLEMSIIIAYFSKSGLENVQKIKNNKNEEIENYSKGEEINENKPSES